MVELELTDDQELLRESTVRFIEATCPLSTVRGLVDSPTGVPEDYVRSAAELGWYAMLVPEALGGGSVSGEGVRDLAIIAEERGRRLQPGPFVSMNVVAAALVESGSPEQVEVVAGIRAGDVVATWVIGDAVDQGDTGASITATPGSHGIELSGHAGLVQDGLLADWFLVTARTDGRNGGGSDSDPPNRSQYLVPAATAGLTVTPLVGHDITQRLAAVSCDGVTIPVAFQVGGNGDLGVERQLQLACVLSTSETVGAMAALFEMTCQYALDRTAFGRPIGSFQAIKHQLADLSLSLECGKAVTAEAVRAVQAGQENAGEIASMAKAWVGDTGIDMAQGCFQVFGGIGYTWEHDLHLFLRRITMNALLFGQPAWHRERICARHGV
jgi:alkylation response protein AidB-like acyl-CoA dehydrogenase